MKLRLLKFWDDVHETFWFLPTLMVIGAIGLSLATIQLDRATPSRNWVATLGWTFSRGPEGSRALLSTVAGSMMTIASVTFSITIVALQLASSQFGPRLLRNFMRDRGNQLSIGTFIATFTYCLLILRTVNGTQDQPFVPHISVTIGLVMALASLGVLIYFIHHAAESIQAETVIAGVSRELEQAIKRLYPDGAGAGSGRDAGSRLAALPEGFEGGSRPVFSTSSDSLQAIDLESLLRLATERDLVIRLVQRPGKFVLRGGELARVWPGESLDEDLADSIRSAYYLGVRRSLTQDVEFAIDQLVEVAVRALSPGVNDPFTAIHCVDRLAAALGLLAGKEIPSTSRLDEEGRLRLVVDASTLPGLVEESFRQVRQAARGDASVTIRMLEVIVALAEQAKDPTFREALRRQADAIQRGSRGGLVDPIDREDVDRRHRLAIRELGGDLS